MFSEEPVQTHDVNNTDFYNCPVFPLTYNQWFKQVNSLPQVKNKRNLLLMIPVKYVNELHYYRI